VDVDGGNYFEEAMTTNNFDEWRIENVRMARMHQFIHIIIYTMDPDFWCKL
jgi:hypothetical protein